MKLSIFSAFALASTAFAANTNTDINNFVDSLSESLHIILPNILTLVAAHQANATTIGAQFAQLNTVWGAAGRDLGNVAPSDGSTTTAPTNDDISVTFASTLSLTASSLSNLTPTLVANVNSMFSELDPIVSGAVANFTTALPGGLALVHDLMLDAKQFFQAEGLLLTVTSLGF